MKNDKIPGFILPLGLLGMIFSLSPITRSFFDLLSEIDVLGTNDKKDFYIGLIMFALSLLLFLITLGANIFIWVRYLNQKQNT